MTENKFDLTSRRGVLKAGGVLAASLPVASYAQVNGSSEIKVALVGCGGRGTGAASQTLTSGGTKLVAVADAFRNTAESVVKRLKEKFPKQVDVPDERIFDGFDAYREAIDAADVVILATTPGFRPYHFEYAVEKGKHVFMEKPVATDAPGIRKVLEVAKKADEKNLKVVCGLQRHYQNSYLETLEQVKKGVVGDLIS
ncbi:MAG: Gfo/Idh/MocA family protein, partial [Verrucomicrobiales bacterium]